MAFNVAEAKAFIEEEFTKSALPAIIGISKNNCFHYCILNFPRIRQNPQSFQKLRRQLGFQRSSRKGCEPHKRLD